MNRSQRVRLTLREQARHRVRAATTWAGVGAGTLAAAFAVVLTQHTATAAPETDSTPPSSSQGDTAQSGPQLQPPMQAPTAGSSDNSDNNYGNQYYGTSGGS